ncbi:uncharacterized protein LOC129757345 isoform X1 [Uranotaenia lowii]|uniref:uncharacterized protein LOC129757345 isoform X1 n=1 Tax=Uranotaenia lowii TaxID=190385 RepID=UPI00247B1710|nr:uncharacterized protein LOC129757345 isoform X1 [Uranotaenia lowii]XP_055610510.1 uncharacterized protein LOC129757345 isoform X1 [Uranotaenia lowii]
MAPSPELGGQPKAPDKSGASENSASTGNSSSSTTVPAAVVAATSSTPAAAATSSTTETTSSLSSVSNSTKQSSSAGTKHTSGTSSSGSATSQQQDSSNIENMPDHDLKALLEEAITYKCPKDREHKSAAFNVSEPNFKNSHFQLKFTYQRVKNAKQKSIITKLSVLRENLLRHKKRRNSERKQISSRSGKIMYGRDGWGS